MATVLEALVNQAELFINILIAAKVINPDDDSVVQALVVLSKMNASLKVADAVVQRLKKYVPEDLAQVPDLNGDGVIDSKDLAALLRDGQATLTDLITQELVTSENAEAWNKVFIALITALEDPHAGLKEVTPRRFAEAKQSLGREGILAISNRLEDRDANRDHIRRLYPARSGLVSENARVRRDNAVLSRENQRLNRRITAIETSEDVSVESALARRQFQLVPIRREALLPSRSSARAYVVPRPYF